MAVDSMDSFSVRGPSFFSVHYFFLKGPFFSVTGVYLLVVTLVVKETRASVTLAKLAGKLRKETGDIRYQPFLPELERHNLRQMIYISCTRPVCGSKS